VIATKRRDACNKRGLVKNNKESTIANTTTHLQYKKQSKLKTQNKLASGERTGCMPTSVSYCRCIACDDESTQPSADHAVSPPPPPPQHCALAPRDAKSAAHAHSTRICVLIDIISYPLVLNRRAGEKCSAGEVCFVVCVVVET
jgi:hypothetical protein